MKSSMKQQIVIQVTLDCNKCQSKALSIAAAAKGVSSVSIEGRNKDQVMVIGDRVDPICLARLLRKKFRYASILSVQQLKEESKEERMKKEEENDNNRVPTMYCATTIPYPLYRYPTSCSCHLVYDIDDPYPTTSCSIL